MTLPKFLLLLRHFAQIPSATLKLPKTQCTAQRLLSVGLALFGQSGKKLCATSSSSSSSSVLFDV